MKQLLSLRVSRRAIGAAVLDTEGLKFVDARHLRSNGQQAIAAAITFVDSFLEDPAIRAIAVDRPLPGSSTVGDRLSEHLATAARSRGILLLPLDRTAILASYGVTPARARGEVRALVSEYWPLLSEMRQPQPHIVDAAAAGLCAECQLALNPPKT